MRIILFALLFFSPLSFAASKAIFSAKLVTGASSAVRPESFSHTDQLFQVTGSTASGAGAASVSLEGSNDGTNWLEIGSVWLTLGTSVTSGQVASKENWIFVRGNVTSISGTGASIDATLNW